MNRNPFVFCYCTRRFDECEVCKLISNYSNFCYDKRVITCFKFVVKCGVDVAIRKKKILDKMRDKTLFDDLSYTNTNSSCLAGLCIHNLMRTIDAKQLFLDKSYYDITEQRISLIRMIF